LAFEVRPSLSSLVKIQKTSVVIRYTLVSGSSTSSTTYSTTNARFFEYGLVTNGET